MQCPECKIELVISSEKRRYETLLDHVSDPNGKSPMRSCYVCPNEKCCLFENAFWDSQGDFYNLTGKGLDWAKENSLTHWKHVEKVDVPKGIAALNSNSRQIDEDIENSKKDRKNVKL